MLGLTGAEVTLLLWTGSDSLARRAVSSALGACAREREQLAVLSRGEAAAIVACEVCRSGEDDEHMLLCDKCDAGYHMYCLTPAITAVPDGDWYCPRCIGGNAATSQPPLSACSATAAANAATNAAGGSFSCVLPSVLASDEVACSVARLLSTEVVLGEDDARRALRKLKGLLLALAAAPSAAALELMARNSGNGGTTVGSTEVGNETANDAHCSALQRLAKTQLAQRQRHAAAADLVTLFLHTGTFWGMREQAALENAPEESNRMIGVTWADMGIDPSHGAATNESGTALVASPTTSVVGAAAPAASGEAQSSRHGDKRGDGGASVADGAVLTLDAPEDFYPQLAPEESKRRARSSRSGKGRSGCAKRGTKRARSTTGDIGMRIDTPPEFPSGWTVFRCTYPSGKHEHRFVAPDGAIFRSRKSALEFIAGARGIVNSTGVPSSVPSASQATIAGGKPVSKKKRASASSSSTTSATSSTEEEAVPLLSARVALPVHSDCRGLSYKVSRAPRQSRLTEASTAVGVQNLNTDGPRERENVEMAEATAPPALSDVAYHVEPVYSRAYALGQLLLWHQLGGDAKGVALPSMRHSALRLWLPSVEQCYPSPTTEGVGGAAEVYGKSKRQALLRFMRSELQRYTASKEARACKLLPCCWPPELERAFQLQGAPLLEAHCSLEDQGAPCDGTRSPAPTLVLGSPFLDCAIDVMADVTRDGGLPFASSTITASNGGGANIEGAMRELEGEDEAAVSLPHGPVQWVQCEEPCCLKWRKIPAHVDAAQLPEQFFCRLNEWDPARSSCDAPQEEDDQADVTVSWELGELETLEVGDKLDAYCVVNHVWYEAKVADATETKVRVHFMQWHVDAAAPHTRAA